MLKLVCRKPGDLAPFLRGEDKDSAMKRILANIHQHAAVCKHFGVRNLRAVAKCDKGILHDHSSFKKKESAKVIGKEKSGIIVTDNPVLVWSDRPKRHEIPQAPVETGGPECPRSVLYTR